MPDFHVDRSIVINAPVEEVFDSVADFSQWTRWSPWLCADKAAEVTVSDEPSSVGAIYKWVGELVGEGEMEHQKLQRPTRIDNEIRIAKPFKSRSQVVFEFVPQGDATKITWHMNGKLPWVMFWMKSMMETIIGMDYTRGLKMLKEWIETGTVNSDTEIKGLESITAWDVIGLRASCVMDDISSSMEQAIATVQAKLGESGIGTDGEMISVYHSLDMKQQLFDYTVGYTVDASTIAPEPLSKIHLPAGQSLVIRHTGSYQNLGNAWSAGYQYTRNKKIKVAKRPAHEIYRNDPGETPAAELITDIYLPIK